MTALRFPFQTPWPKVSPGAKDGNKMAMSNIRQRFELAYGSKGVRRR